jgi:HAE1 family hydrophobic/amphiphilic exporter-1
MSRHGSARSIFAFLVRRPVLLLTLFVTCAVVGAIAYSRIPVQMMPDGIVEPGLQIYVTNPNASAQENEEQVARVLEAELRTLPRIENIESNSRSDSVSIFVEFKSDTDMNFAKAEVRDRVERARPQLPTTVEEIGIWSWNESDLPVMFFAIKHPGDSARTDFLVENVIKRRIESVDGVGKTDVWGLRDDSLRILLDEDRVRAARLDIGALIRRLSADNFALPMGEVEDGGRRILLRSDMRFRSPEEIASYPIGGGLTIGDVATILPVKTVQRALFRIDGSYAYFGEVQKDGQANVVDTCKRLHAALDELEKDPALAGNFKFMVVFDQGQFIQSSISQLTDTALTGGLLAVLILFLFFWRVRLTLLVAMSIPASLLLAVSWLFFTGRSFNVLAMTGITLAMGMLVDNAIVVVENITRIRTLGRSKRESAIEGTSEVGLAILLSTLTTVVVFLPLIFMTENPTLRIIFGELGLPLCVSLLASLLVALVFLPVSTERALGGRPRFVGRLSSVFAPILSLPARLLGRVLGIAGAALTRLGRMLAATLHAVCAVLIPLRWPLAIGFLAFAAWRFLAAAGVYAPLAPLAAFRAIPEPAPLGPGGWPILLAVVPAVLAATLVLFGPKRWRRRFAADAAASSPVSAPLPVPAGPAAKDSIIGFVVAATGRLARWTMDHRIASSGERRAWRAGSAA